jgi:hypothetical protein
MCINQEDSDERTAQVSIMHHIFGLADRVVAYIGEETPGSRLVLEELHAIEELDEDSLRLRPRPDRELIAELDKLIRRPWFTRVWVVQEVYMPKRKDRVLIACGSMQASFEALRECVWGYDNLRITSLPTPFILKPEADPELGILAIGGKRFRDTRAVAVYPQRQGSAETLWNLLSSTRRLMATDPRDKIIALGTLIPFQDSDIGHIMTYNRSVESVFTETALYLLPVVGLWLLLGVRHPHSMNMPSWVPDWSQDSAIHYYAGLWWNREDYLSGDRGAEALVLHRSNPLYYSPTQVNFNTIRMDVFFQVNSPPGHNVADYTSGPHANRPTAFGLRNGDHCQNKNAILNIQGIRRSTIASLGEVFDFKRDKNRCLQSVQDLKITLATAKMGILRQNFHVPSEILEVTRKLLVRESDGYDFLTRDSEHIIESHIVEIQESFWHYEYLVRIEEALHGCRLFVDDVGHVGIAPGAACKGDIVCQLGNVFETECIVRKRHESGWSLISGDCWRNSPHWSVDSDDIARMETFEIW